MDAIGHAVVTAAVSGSPLAVVASAINLRYDGKGLEALRQALPPQHAPLALGIESHIAANKYVHYHPLLLAMQKLARPILAKNGIRDIFSHVAVELTIDNLLMENETNRAFTAKMWQEFDWQAAQHYLPPYSRSPARAKTVIAYVRRRLESDGVDYASGLLERLVTMQNHASEPAPKPEACRSAVSELADVLRKSSSYRELVYAAQQELERQLMATAATL